MCKGGGGIRQAGLSHLYYISKQLFQGFVESFGAFFVVAEILKGACPHTLSSSVFLTANCNLYLSPSARDTLTFPPFFLPLLFFIANLNPFSFGPRDRYGGVWIWKKNNLEFLIPAYLSSISGEMGERSGRKKFFPIGWQNNCTSFFWKGKRKFPFLYIQMRVCSGFEFRILLRLAHSLTEFSQI